MEITKDMFSESFQELKKSSCETFYYGYRRIIKELFNGVESVQNFDISDEALTKYINSLPVGSQQPVLGGFVKAYKITFKKDCERLDKLFSSICKKISKDNLLKPATQKQKDNYISMDELITKREEMKESNFWRYWLLAWYSYIPPLRQSELTTAKILLNDNGEAVNRLILNEAKLIITEHKTASSYGEKIINIPKELVDITKEAINKFNPLYVLAREKAPTTPTNHDTITKAFNAIFHKKVSPSMIRNIFISQKLDQGASFTAEERKKTAEIMGHSVSTAYAIYSKHAGIHKEENKQEEIKKLFKTLSAEERKALLKELVDEI